MNHHLNPQKTGLALGMLLGGFHTVWSLLVALGWAQPLVDFIFWAHMVRVAYIIEPFSFEQALILIAITTGGGFVLGNIFAAIWNHAHKAR